MKILVVSNNYPSPIAPNTGVFVYNLIQQFAKLGHQLNIIAPESIIHQFILREKQSYGEELGKVYRPRFLSTSAKRIFNFNTYGLGENFQIDAVKRTVKRNRIEFDIVYAHFLSNAFIAVRALSSFGKPIYAALGESNIDARKAFYNSDYFHRQLSGIKGFIAVSPKLRDRLISFGVDQNKIVVRPNAVDLNKFYQRDKIQMRKKYGFPLDKKLIIFVGRFLYHKGPKRVLEAVEEMKDVRLIYVGSGNEELHGNQIIFKDKVPSRSVPELLSSADLFVLPTLCEGSCNSIIEALACGLPVVSSNIPEVDIQCDPSFSILVDPLNIKAIRKAIKTILENNEKQKIMSKSALEYAEKFDIRERASSILSFIQHGHRKEVS